MRRRSPSHCYVWWILNQQRLTSLAKPWDDTIGLIILCNGDLWDQPLLTLWAIPLSDGAGSTIGASHNWHEFDVYARAIPPSNDYDSIACCDVVVSCWCKYIYGICYYEILAAGTSKSFTCAVLTIGIAGILFVFNWYDFTFIIGDLNISFNEPQNHFWESMVFR